MSNILDGLESLEDLKKLNNKQLESLADEIRAFLIENITKTGGHIASNLGTVELTIALHRVFNSPKDKIIFDVGHQCYTHKILTGRKNRFSTLRQYGGLSGFPKPEESEHDIFKTGHSSTSISVAAGLARARRLLGEDYSVVAVIGDGALTGGMVFEALNDIGHSDDKIIIILNDNQMSIDKNVGAMHVHFASLRSSPRYYKFKKHTENFFKRIPLVGTLLVSGFTSIKRTVKSIFIKDMFFEELGFTYIGGIDGHDIAKLQNAFQLAKKAPKNVIVHVMTKKGKGYENAEQCPWNYHGISAKNSNSHGSNSGFFGEKLTQLAELDDRIVAVTAAMKSGTGLQDFEKRFPNRFFDVGIAEQHAVTMCAGLSTMQLIPVFAVYSTFLQRAYDQVLHDVCLQNLHVVFGIDRAGLVGADGETHHGVYDISYLRQMPNMTILEPATNGELKAMLEYAIYRVSGPVAIRYPREQLPNETNRESQCHRVWEICRHCS